MPRFLGGLAAAALLAMASPAGAQYVPPAPGYPGVSPPTNVNPGYKWREQRLNQDPRVNNAPVQHNQPRQNVDTSRIGVTDPAKNDSAGECAVGSSEETCRARGQKYNPPRN